MTAPLEVVQSGSFCWNEQCPRYGEVGAGNMRRFGKTSNGVQRFQCKACGKVFTATRGTPFYGIHDPEKMLRALALLSERVSIRGVGRATGAKPDAVIEWMEKAAAHVELTERLLQRHHQLKRAQLDALWAFVGHKGEKGGDRRKRSGGASGAPG
jgi:transposase-like protein